jgi:hypothetical protein
MMAESRERAQKAGISEQNIIASLIQMILGSRGLLGGQCYDFINS